MANDNNAVNLDTAQVTVSWDSDARKASRPVSLKVWQMIESQQKLAFCLELSLSEATDIAENLRSAAEFGERIQKNKGGDL